MSEKREVEPGCGFIILGSLIFGALFAIAAYLQRVAKALEGLL